MKGEGSGGGGVERRGDGDDGEGRVSRLLWGRALN